MTAPPRIAEPLPLIDMDAGEFRPPSREKPRHELSRGRTLVFGVQGHTQSCSRIKRTSDF